MSTGELHRVEEQLEVLNDATSFGEWESPDQAAQRHALNADWLRLDDEIRSSERAEAASEERAAEAAPDQPANFDEWHTEVAAWGDRLLDMRARAEELAEQARSLPEHSARREVAERRAREALAAAREQTAALDGWKNENEMRLANEKMADDAAVREATRRWVQHYQGVLVGLKEHEEKRKREGLAVWSSERERQEIGVLMRKPPSAEFIAAVRSELVAANAEKAVGFDRERLEAAVEAAKRSTNPAVIALAEEQARGTSVPGRGSLLAGA